MKARLAQFLGMPVAANANALQAGPAPEPTQMAPAQGGPSPDMNLGQGRLRGQAQEGQLPPLEYQSQTRITQAPDTRTSEQAVQDSQGQNGSSVGQPGVGRSHSDIFDYDSVVNKGGVQAKTAID